MSPSLPDASAAWGRAVTRDPGSQAHWSRLAERGSGLGLALILGCYRLLGPVAVRLLLYPAVLYFFVVVTRARRASLDYLRRVAAVQGQGWQPGWRDSLKHMMAFAVSSADKIGAWLGKVDVSRIEFPERAAFERTLASGQGAVLVGAHLGNLEMLRAVASQSAVPINAVVYTRHAERFNRTLAAASAGFNVNLLHVQSLGPDTAVLLKEKVEKGELIVIVGDRVPPVEQGHSRRVSVVDFMGAKAAFPQGPFILAALLECPAYLFFCLPEGNGYRVHFELFAERIQLPRRERDARLQLLVQRYAQRLEFYCLTAPLQWFNFFDFWQAEPTADAATTRAP